jgi:hypothetical protein
MGFIETATRQASIIDLGAKATVNAITPSGNVSQKYSMASTSDILNIFRSEGWEPVGYQEKRARVQERQGKQTHTVVLANSQLNNSLMVSGTLPRIMLKNSHDGGSSLQFLSGLFERICANGLVVGASASDIRLKHIGLTEDLIIAGIQQCVRSLAKALELSEKMRAINMDQGQQLAFAQDVIDMAWDGSAYSILPNQLLYNHRREQRIPTLWNTFNTVQERVIRGGVTQIRADGSRIRSREVKAIDRSIELNRGMWDLAAARCIAA